MKVGVGIFASGSIKNSAGHWPMGGHESFVAPDERIDIAITHALRGIGCQRRPVTAPAIHDDFGIHVGNQFFQVAFQNAFAKVNGLRGVAGLPFALFAHVHEDSLRIAGQPIARFVHCDLLHAGPRFVDQFEESWRVLHTPQISPALGPVNEFSPGCRHFGIEWSLFFTCGPRCVLVHRITPDAWQALAAK